MSIELGELGMANMRPAALLKLILPLACILPTACSRPTESTQSIPTGGGRPAYAFDLSHAVSLTIAKADPTTGEHWIARVERNPEAPATFHELDPWMIRSYSAAENLPDRLANRNYILHLIDTLQTFHANAIVNGDPSVDARASYGLTPPRYALQWEVRDGQVTKNFAIEIGNVTDPKAEMAKESYGTFPPAHSIYRVDGAAIAMLDYLKNFATLRHEVLSPVTSDDIDEIEIVRGKKKVFYAQREGDVWTNEKHRPWKKDVAGFLDRITHLRIQAFIDLEEETTPLLQELSKHPLVEITLKDRLGNPTVFIFAKKKNRELAEVSNRGKAVFVLFPTALKKLEP